MLNLFSRRPSPTELEKDVVKAFLTDDLGFKITAGTRKIEFAVKFQNIPSPYQAVQAGLKELESFSQDLQAAVRSAPARYRYGF